MDGYNNGGTPDDTMNGWYNNGGTPDDTMNGWYNNGGTPDDTVNGWYNNGGTPDDTMNGWYNNGDTPDDTMNGGYNNGGTPDDIMKGGYNNGGTPDDTMNGGIVQRKISVLQDNQAEDLLDIKVEVIGEEDQMYMRADLECKEEETFVNDKGDGSNKKNVSERYPSPVNTLDRSVEHYSVPKDLQNHGEHLIDIKPEVTSKDDEANARNEQQCKEEDIPVNIGQDGYSNSNGVPQDHQIYIKEEIKEEEEEELLVTINQRSRSPDHITTVFGHRMNTKTKMLCPVYKGKKIIWDSPGQKNIAQAIHGRHENTALVPDICNYENVFETSACCDSSNRTRIGEKLFTRSTFGKDPKRQSFMCSRCGKCFKHRVLWTDEMRVTLDGPKAGSVKDRELNSDSDASKVEIKMNLDIFGVYELVMTWRIMVAAR
ncbi:unnamed protein product [Ranitomeya imitator]|uniref:Transposase n=1 Tax=Ranitomeya imitator TaxID=111125 RepID=A0ABN9LXN0_9NEOB|nr:unnamed protein product [Ranitomeya imitator]